MTKKQFDKTNSGAIFRNEKKRSQNSPDHTGQAEIACPHCGATHETWIAAWVKTAANTGQRFFTLAFTPKEEARLTGKRTPAEAAKEDYKDDIPF